MSDISPGVASSHAHMSRTEQSKVASYTHQHPANIQALQTFKVILQSCYGPFGHLKMVQNECGGHVTVTSSSQRLLGALSLSKPILKLIAAAIEGHLKVYSDGGLYTGILASTLIERCWESGLHPAMCIAVNESLLEVCQKAISSPNFQIPIDSGCMDVLLSLVKSVVGSKPACGMTVEEISFVSSLVVQSFIASLPTAGQDGHLTIPKVQMMGIESQAVTESHIIQGVLIEAPDVNSYFIKEILLPRVETGIRQGCVRVAVYNISLAGDSEEFAEARYEFALGLKVQDATLASMEQLVESLVKLNVGLLACQKVVHPSIKQGLRREGILTVDRISLLHIEAVLQITGASALSSLDPAIPESSLGHLTDIKHHVMFDKSNLHLTNQSSSLCTLVLCNISEQSLEELKHVCQVAYHTLSLNLRDSIALPGAGCLEFIIAQKVREEVKGSIMALTEEVGCTSAQLLQLAENFASSLESVAMAMDHDGGHHVTDSASHHHWLLPKGTLADPDWLDNLGRCGCGMISANELRDTEWTVAGKLKCGVYKNKTVRDSTLLNTQSHSVHISGDELKSPDHGVSGDYPKSEGQHRITEINSSYPKHREPHDSASMSRDYCSTESSHDAFQKSKTRINSPPPQNEVNESPPFHGEKVRGDSDNNLVIKNEVMHESILDLLVIKRNAFCVAVDIANLVLRIGHTIENVN